MEAAYSGHTEVVKVLIEKGAVLMQKIVMGIQQQIWQKKRGMEIS